MQPIEIPEPALGPKLEWMLLSHQVSQADLIESLVREYYLSIYRGVLPYLEGPQEANIVSRRALARAVEQAHTYRIGQGVSIWIEEIAKEICQEYVRRRKITRLIPIFVLDTRRKYERVVTYPIPEEVTKLDEAQVQFIIAAVISGIQYASLRRKFSRSILWMMMVGFGLVFLAILNLTDESYPTISEALPIGTHKVSALRQEDVVPQRTPSFPYMQKDEGSYLSAESSIEDIIQFVRGSSNRLTNLWADGLTIDYGPRGYRGPAIVQREQLWLSPPAHSRVITGPLHEGKPNQLWVAMSGHVIKGDENGGAWEQFISSGTIEYTDFRPLLRPAFAHFKEGRSVILGEEVIAGRDTIVLDYFLRNGRHEGRYSIDVHTGVGLRLRRYTDNSLRWVREERLITEIEFNVEMSPNLFKPSYQRPLVYTSGPMGLPETSQSRLSNILVDGIGGRSLLPQLEPPMDFDIAQHDLTYQFLNITRLGALADVAGLYASSYYLGSVTFDDPWRVQCTRSPDGQLVAFYAEAPTYDEDPSPLRWIDLNDLNEVYNPVPKVLPMGNLAFSPDGDQLALAGCNSASNDECSIYVLDLESNLATGLFDLQGATSLVWSPDGQQIAFLGGRDSDPEWQIYVLDAVSGQMIYKGRVSMVLSTIRARSNSPLNEWNVSFPVPTRGLNDCIAAP